MSKKLTDAIAEMRESQRIDGNVEYLLDFLIRSFEHGRHGRYLESLRRA